MKNHLKQCLSNHICPVRWRGSMCGRRRDGEMEFVYLVKIYDSTGRLLPVVTAFATRQGAEAYVHDFLPTGKYQDGVAACKAEIVKTEVRK